MATNLQLLRPIQCIRFTGTLNVMSIETSLRRDCDLSAIINDDIEEWYHNSCVVSEE